MKRYTMLLGIIIGVQALNANAELIDQIELGVRYDNNLTKAKMPSDIKTDTNLTIAVSSGNGYQLSDNGRLVWNAKLAATKYKRYHGLDNVSGGLDLAYRWKFGIGSTVPELHVSAGATRLVVNDSARTGWLYVSELGLSKRLSQRAGGQIAYQVERRRSDTLAARVLPTIPADVFDLKSRNLVLSGDYALTPDYVFAAGYSYRKGDVLSTTLRNFPIFLASTAIALDPVFGAEQFAYKLNALTQTANFGISRLIGEQTSVTLGYEYLYSRGTGGNDYKSSLIGLTYLKQF
jgi:hypothetical protein